MSDVQVRPFRRGDRDQLTRLVNAHAEAVVPGMSVSVNTVLGSLERQPGEFIVDPWVSERVTLVAEQRGRVAAAAHLLNALTSPGNPETPLHYAASSDDADVAEALINGGADLEVPGGSIGTPLDNAVGYGCWHVARLLVARGAQVDKLWHAAALGLLPRLEELIVAGPAAEELNEAFWQACHGGQRRAAELLLNQGADPVRIPGYASGQTPVEVAGALDTRRENLVGWLRERTGA